MSYSLLSVQSAVQSPLETLSCRTEQTRSRGTEMRGRTWAQCPAVRGSAGGTCLGVPERSVPETGEDPAFRGEHPAYIAVWCV